MVDGIFKFLSKHGLTLFIIGFALLTCSTVFIGLDYYWHIKVGEEMLTLKSILTTDIFSWFLAGKNATWVCHEWLFEVFIYLLKVLFKNYHIIIYACSCILALYLLLYRFNKENFKKNIIFTILWLILGATLLSGTICPRPQLMMYILLAITLALLYDLAKHEFSKKIYFLPLIAMLWANVHGGSSNLPYILTGMFLFSGLIKFSFGNIESKAFTKQQIRRYFIVFILCIVAVIINPSFLLMLRYPYDNMRDSFMLKVIVEWRSVDFNRFEDLRILFSFALVLFLLLKSKQKHQLIDLMVIAVFSFLTMKSVRFAPLFFIGSTFVIFNYIKEWKMTKQAYLVLGISSFLFIFLGSQSLMEFYSKQEEPLINEDFITYLKDHDIKRLYNSYEYGGYLIYKDILVFIDGRADLYSSYNFQDAYHLSVLEGNFPKMLESYHFDYLLVSKLFPLATYLESSPSYEVVMEDSECALFKAVAN